MVAKCSTGRLLIDRGGRSWIFAGMAAALLALAAPVCAAGDGGSSSLEIVNRLDAVERQNNDLRQEVLQLRQQVNANAQRTAEAQKASALATSELSQYVTPKKSGTTQVGLRTGWAESPYAMPGAFFYGAYINHRLLTREDGIPYGDVTGELMAGAVFGNGAKTNGALTGQLGLGSS